MIQKGLNTTNFKKFEMNIMFDWLRINIQIYFYFNISIFK